MKKVAILTLNGYFNYGNRLQNYATQEIIKSLGFSVETLIVETSSSSNKRLKTNGIKRITTFVKPRNLYYRIFTKAWRLLNTQEISISEKKRTTIFKKFTEDFIKETGFVMKDVNIPEDLSDRYDYFIVGSDQVWNPSYNNGSSIYFLNFTEKSKRIALSPSFGVSKIEKEYKEQYKEWLLGMHKLSVREDAGRGIIKELTGRDALVLVDPTLMLTKENWLSISKEAPNKPSKYLLTYFLGGIESEDQKIIKSIAKKNNLKIVNLADLYDPEAYRTGPSEFIDYINSSALFCTDSFHGTVFSLLLETPFIVFERKSKSASMYSRIDTLLNKFQLSSRKLENIKYANEDIFTTDYSHISAILEKERIAFISYLKEALEVK